MQVGQTATATAVPNGVIPAGTVIQWTSSDITVATVPTPDPDTTGLTSPVTGVGPGTATITITATRPDNVIAQGSAVATVAPAPPVLVTSFTVTIT
jgi:uncharacterized protein YjdB